MFSSTNIKMGFFLAKKQIKRSNPWTTVLIIFVMFFTFLNLVVVSGILVGLLQGAVNEVKAYYTSDVIISSLNNKNYIENSPEIVNIIKGMPQVDSFTSRYLDRATLEANYKTRTDLTEKPNTAGASIVGIDPLSEDKVTSLSDFIVEGEYLSKGDYDQVLLGKYLVKKYSPVDSPGFSALDNVVPGTKIKVTTNGVTREVMVKGIIDSKVDELGMRVFMVDSQLRSLIGRNDNNVAEISIKIKEGESAELVRDILKSNGIDAVAKVQTSEDAEPKFIKDMKDTFSLLGNILSSLGLVVASITIFIVIFINAITRRKFIGILKGIGINEKAIEISYIIQSFFYAFCGSAFGFLFLYLFLVPVIDAHPIDFAFANGVLVAPVGGTLLRVGILMATTILAGFIPARMIVRKNTLNSILGRN